MSRAQTLAWLYSAIEAGDVTLEAGTRLETIIRAHVPEKGRGPAYPRRIRPKVRDDGRSRRLACRRDLPDHIAAGFTEKQRAVLVFLGMHRVTEVSNAEIATRCGCSVRTVQNVLRIAAGDGLISVTYRPARRAGELSRTNIVRVVSREWLAWLDRGPKGRGVGADRFAPSDQGDSKGLVRRVEQGLDHATLAQGIALIGRHQPPGRPQHLLEIADRVHGLVGVRPMLVGKIDQTIDPAVRNGGHRLSSGLEGAIGRLAIAMQGRGL